MMIENLIEDCHEWYYPIEADHIGEDKKAIEISPDDSQKEALARRLGVAKIENLTAHLVLRRNQGNMVIYIQGEINAEIIQSCIITLAPVRQEISEKFEAWYADARQAVSFAKAKRERVNIKEKGEQPILDESEDPEAIIDGKIDLGELVTQHLSLAIDPYPRAQGAVSDVIDDEALKGEADTSYDNPFAALKEWRAKENKEEC